MRQHVSDKIFELLTKEASGLALLVRAPEHVRSEFDEELVMGVLWDSLIEWRVTGIHNEEDDTESE